MLIFAKNIQLYKFDEVPKFQQYNPYIRCGYRAYLSATDCMRSVVLWSNEFLNVWSHVFTFFVFVFLLMYDQFCNLPRYNSMMTDHIVFLIFHICCQICMLFSSAYHTFNCHLKYAVVQSWLSADLAGITAAILGCYAIGLYYGFYCHEQLRALYMCLCSMVICISMVMMLNPKYSSEEWQGIRVTHLTLICLMGFCPIFNWFYVAPTYEMKFILPRIIKFYLILGAAMFFYLFKFPERCLPGRFDFIGQSHTIWHLLISSSLLYWRSFALDLAQYRAFDQCLCKSCFGTPPGSQF